jgi:putative transposase
MHEWESLSHVRWDCKYHVVVVPKYRRKVLYGRIRNEVHEILLDLCKQREVEVVECTLKLGYVHMCLRVPPMYSIAHWCPKTTRSCFITS